MQCHHLGQPKGFGGFNLSVLSEECPGEAYWPSIQQEKELGRRIYGGHFGFRRKAVASLLRSSVNGFCFCFIYFILF